MRYVALLVAAGLSVSSAQASVLHYGTDGLVNGLEIAPGSTGAISVYLYEVFDPATETSILEEEEGLFSAGVAVRRTAGGLMQPAGVLSVADISPNPAFSETDPGISPLKAVDLPGGLFGSASLVESCDLLATEGVGVESVAADARRVFLGTFTFTAGGVLGEITALRVEDNDVALDDTVTWALPGISLDADIRPFDFTITAVPEPASIFLLGLGGMALLARRRE